ncbi:Chagasin family peptidase inhibitor I42 [Mucilaginibacter pineti]|uniref:Chagasin family peptidase inhibitor I42 n=1 Tax=Mucilaginibacter pineti TaxID=1391627 RepID=A0A1G7I5C7_9SPHI|nr:protease inhibitor I42 family protein [Mucilaginibacter pineti]SDF07788.1 Chagasin family peptidase inhibitor I42 [Mucilaginibacter pineti]
MKLLYNSICIIACLAVTACHKDKKTEVVKQLTIADAGSTASVSMGETISLTLGNPGDGGYQVNDPLYKTSVLTLVSHTHQNSTTNAVGDAGNDTWKFTAKGSGTTTLEITASRGTQGADKISLFSNQITVK